MSDNKLNKKLEDLVNKEMSFISFKELVYELTGQPFENIYSESELKTMERKCQKSYSP